MKNKLILSCMAAVILCACADSGSSQVTEITSDIQTETQATETQTTEAVTAETTTQQTEETTAQTEETTQTEAITMSYMEKYSDLVVQVPPQGYDEAREGVEYPEFQTLIYYSNTAERETPVNVLVPADYSKDKEYPVLYILHGFWDNQDWMARDVVGLSQILTNLQADGEAEEMIVVLPYIFCSKEMQYCTGMDEANCLAYDNFVNDMMTDLIPFIEENFSVAKGRENTAITGFSMGGREALFIGFTHPDMFGYIGAVCPAPGLVSMGSMFPGQIDRSELSFTGDKAYAVLVTSSKVDGVVGESPDSYRAIMDENGTEYLTQVLENTGHDHSSVKPHLYDYFRILFKDR
ncbi:MAG: hypothetical protein J6I96_06460 [Oscillospiraceae bacterium]|nr:hypothetical protein [Oscillospiraceae bacterium]